MVAKSIKFTASLDFDSPKVKEKRAAVDKAIEDLQEVVMETLTFSEEENEHETDQKQLLMTLIPKTKEDFDSLVKTWKEDTQFLSNPDKIVAHQAYLTICKMGWRAIPFIIEEMKSSPSFWFYSLERITGAMPIKIQHRGDIQAMTNDWLEWFDENLILPGSTVVVIDGKHDKLFGSEFVIMGITEDGFYQLGSSVDQLIASCYMGRKQVKKVLS